MDILKDAQYENLPYAINYDITVTPPEKMEQIINDYDHITYTEHFEDNRDEIIKSRFPGGDCDHIPGLSEVFETMALKLKVTPLSEWIDRGFTDNNKN